MIFLLGFWLGGVAVSGFAVLFHRKEDGIHRMVDTRLMVEILAIIGWPLFILYPFFVKPSEAELGIFEDDYE